MKRLISLTLTVALCAALTVPALAAEAPAFSDVPGDAWYAEAVGYCALRGLMNGVGGDRFAPDGAATRGMATAVLYRLAGSPEADGDGGFSDVPGWCVSAMAWAGGTGVVQGYGNGRSGAEDNVTRQDLAVMLWRSVGCPRTGGAPDYADEGDIADYAAGAVDWATLRGLMVGKGGNTFDPRGLATRAELAQILTRLTRVEGESVVLDAQWAPSGIAVNASGAMLITDTNNKVVWELASGDVFAGAETVLDLYGEPLGGYSDAGKAESYFKEPWAAAPFLGGWAVSDGANGAVRLILGDGVVTLSSADGKGFAPERPTGLAADDEGNLYIADTGAGVVYRMTPHGVVTTAAKDLSEPTGLCWADGVLYIAETGANRIVKLEKGAVTAVAGSGEEGLEDGPALTAAFCCPQGVAVGPDGTLYVADTVNGAVRYVRDGTVGTLTQRDWASLEQYPISPRGLLVWEESLYVCDNFSRKLLILPLN